MLRGRPPSASQSSRLTSLELSRGSLTQAIRLTRAKAPSTIASVGTDWISLYRGPCRCGKGEFVAEYGTPDHPYPTSSEFWRLTITCEECNRKYALIQQPGSVVVVPLPAVEERERIRNERYERLRALEQSPKVRAPLDDLAKSLADYTQAGMHSALEPLVRVGGTVQTFRRHLKSAGDLRRWLDLNVHVSDLPKITKYLNRRDADLEREVGQIEALWHRSREALPTDGPPLCPERPAWK